MLCVEKLTRRSIRVTHTTTRRIEILMGDFVISEKVVVVYEKTMTSSRNSAGLDTKRKVYRTPSICCYTEGFTVFGLTAGERAESLGFAAL